MTTTRDDVPDRDPLWDPSIADSNAELSALEAGLAPLRFDPTTRPVAWPERPTARRRTRRRVVIGATLALAASLVIVAGLAAWRWSWPEGRSWPMAPSGQLVVGEAYVPAEPARVAVARIGSMAVEPGAEVTLRATASNAHRLVLGRGRIDVRVWAPPGAVVVETPAGDVVDMGCVFSLEVDANDVSRISVSSGWVMLDNAWGESLVPAGTSSAMRPGAAPLVPVFDDADEVFRDGVRRVEGTWSMVASGRPVELDLTFLATARPKDVMTLLRLALVVQDDVRAALVERADTLAPPPPRVDVAAAIAGNDDEIWRWHDALDLPSPKQWWRNWRDGL